MAWRSEYWAVTRDFGANIVTGLSFHRECDNRKDNDHLKVSLFSGRTKDDDDDDSTAWSARGIVVDKLENIR